MILLILIQDVFGLEVTIEVIQITHLTAVPMKDLKEIVTPVVKITLGMLRIAPALQQLLLELGIQRQILMTLTGETCLDLRQYKICRVQDTTFITEKIPVTYLGAADTVMSRLVQEKAQMKDITVI